MTLDAKRKFLINIAFYLIVIAIVYLSFKFLSVYLLPFVIGIFVSFLVQKPVRAICKKTKISKGPLTIVFVVGLYLLIVTIIALIIYLLYRWVNSMIDMVPGALPDIMEFIESLSISVNRLLKGLPVAVTEYFNEIPSKLLDAAQSLGLTISNWAITLVTNIPTYLITIIVTVVASCYIAYDYSIIIALARRYMPTKTWNIILDIKDTFFTNILKMLKSYILLMLITFTELSLGFTIIGIERPILLGAIICVIDILPILGTGTILIPWSIISLFIGNIWLGIELIILYVAITVIRNFLEPKIIGNQVGLHPLITLLAMFCGLRLFGLAGLFGLPLVLIVFNNLLKKGTISFEKSKT